MELNLKAQIDAYFASHGPELIADIADLIRIPSVNGPALPDKPFGEEPTRALEAFLRLSEGGGMRVQNLENRVGTVDLTDGPPCLDILAHLDVVPGGDGWTVTTPFAPLERDGRLYGRGSSDDKGPAVAALHAMKCVKALGIPLRGNVRLIVGIDEETACRDTEFYYASHSEAPFTFSPDADFPVVNIEKGGLHCQYSADWEEEASLPRVVSITGGTAGNVVPGEAQARVEGLGLDAVRAAHCRLEPSLPGIHFESEPSDDGRVRITAFGASTHASTPEEGCNAVTALVTLLVSLPLAPSRGLDALKGLLRVFPHGDTAGVAAGMAQRDELSGALTLCTNVIRYTPTGVRGKVDCRAPLCATEETTLQVLRRAMDEAGLPLEPGAAMTPPHHVPEASPFIQTLLRRYEEYFGQPGKCIATGGGTYVHHLQNGVAFGCMALGTDYHMHGADEFLICREIIQSAALFAQVIADLCS